MGHIVVGDDATGIGIRKTTLDHHAERQLPNQLFMRAVVGLLLQQADETFFGRGHSRTLAPADCKFRRRRLLAHGGNVSKMSENAATPAAWHCWHPDFATTAVESFGAQPR